MTAIKKIYKFLSSIIFAIILLTLTVFLSGLSTLIVQGNNLDFYLEKYKMLGYVIFYSGLTDFFRSVLFIILLSLFFINLLLCTIIRLQKELSGKVKFLLGPDIIHLGILTLIISGLIGVIGIKDSYLILSPGESFSIDGYTITFIDFEFLKYQDNSPKDWISTVKVNKNSDNDHVQTKKLEVNKPLKIKDYMIYQNNFFELKAILLESIKSGKSYNINVGEKFEIEGTIYHLTSLDGNKSATIFNEANKSQKIFSNGSGIGNFMLKNITNTTKTGLYIKKDPTYNLKIISLFIILYGLILTYTQKTKENK